MKGRSFLKAGVAGAIGMVGARRTLVAEPGASLTPYLDALPIPGVLRQTAGSTQVVMSEFRQQLHRNLPPTKLWGYNGTYPGPTIEVTKGTAASFLWDSNLPPKHFLPIDHKLHGADMGAPEVRNVVHLHGIKTMPESDGYAEAWFTPGFKQVGPAFQTQIYGYPNDQPGTTLWCHDHALGISRLNVLAGLAGFYIIRDPAEDAFNLPRGPYEIPLLIQDRLFNSDGSLLYPTETAGTQEVWIPEFFGDTVLVNGKVWPYLEVEPRNYRFRILNASNARFYHMQLVESDRVGKLLGNAGPVFHQIGTQCSRSGAMVISTALTDCSVNRVSCETSGIGPAGECDTEKGLS